MTNQEIRGKILKALYVAYEDVGGYNYGYQTDDIAVEIGVDAKTTRRECETLRRRSYIDIASMDAYHITEFGVEYVENGGEASFAVFSPVVNQTFVEHSTISNSNIGNVNIGLDADQLLKILENAITHAPIKAEEKKDFLDKAKRFFAYPLVVTTFGEGLRALTKSIFGL